MRKTQTDIEVGCEKCKGICNNETIFKRKVNKDDESFEDLPCFCWYCKRKINLKVIRVWQDG